MIEVAAAAILSGDGKVLLGCRPEGKPYAGFWEFPGGKIEEGESALRALIRELQEELGISVKKAHPWITRIFHYRHATVRLHFFKVVDWEGEPAGLENQELRWQNPAAPDVSPMLPANAPILRFLSLPPIYAITQASVLGSERQLASLRHALENGLRLLQIREKTMDKSRLEKFCRQVLDLARPYGARVLVNSDPALAKIADGLHLDARTLMQLHERPDFPWVSASTHSPEELAQAAKLGLDFAVLGPLKPTLSHPGESGLGWQKFSEFVADLPIPVYALGGLQAQDLTTAIEHGAHGVGMIRGAWPEG